ncbi:MAG: LPS assembly lipoprotein LptE [Methylococcales bacterium]|nr:LPS assembly lipoprotein LptE [Methylococcales bacterium]
MNHLVRIILVGVWFFATGCGYQLRGSLDVSDELKKVYITGDSPSLHTEMVNMMKASKGELVALPSEAGVVIKVGKEDMRTRVLSIGTTGKSTEQELDYYMRFQFFDNKDKPLVDEQTIEIAREFFNNQTAVLAKSSEELLIRSEIYKQATRMLMLRAKIAIDNQKANVKKAETPKIDNQQKE